MSFNKTLNTPKNINNEYLNQNGDYLNTFNNNNYSSFRDKMKMMNNYKSNNYFSPNRYNSFFKSSAPFNYYNKMNDRDRLLLRYNGGPQKEYDYNNYITRDNISKFIQKRNNSNRYKRPCGCYSKYNISKYSQVFPHPEYENENQYGFYNQQQKLPLIGDNANNLRYSYTNGFTTPEIKNKRSGKLTYNLKENYENENQLNTESNNLAKNQNANGNVPENVNNINENINQIDNNEVINDGKVEENNENIEKKVSNGNTIFILKNNCFNIKPKRRFHKVQIFNNYKPFLVDDFKEYGYFE